MTVDDDMMLRELKAFTGELLKYADVLPPVVAVMLRGYESELYDSPRERWSGGIGSPARYGDLARLIERDITDGEIPAGRRLDCSLKFWYARAERRDTVEKALHLLAARGELIPVYDGTYYVGRRDGNS
jgi:hypothetical protein